SQSSNSGNDTTLITSTSRQKRKSTPIPATIIVRPAAAVNTSRTNVPTDAGGWEPQREFINRLGGDQPPQKYRHQRQAEHDARAERARADDTDSVRPANMTTLPTSRTHLIETDSHKGPISAKPEASGNSSGIGAAFVVGVKATALGSLSSNSPS